MSGFVPLFFGSMIGACIGILLARLIGFVASASYRVFTKLMDDPQQEE